jgi:hypothetical protein
MLCNIVALPSMVVLFYLALFHSCHADHFGRSVCFTAALLGFSIDMCNRPRLLGLTLVVLLAASLGGALSAWYHTFDPGEGDALRFPCKIDDESSHEKTYHQPYPASQGQTLVLLIALRGWGRRLENWWAPQESVNARSCER